MNSIVKYTPPAEDGAFVSIADTARSARRRLWIVILVPLLTVSAAVGVSLLQQPVYDISAEVVLSPIGSQQDNLSNTISGLQALAIEMEAAGLNRSMVEEIVRPKASLAQYPKQSSMKTQPARSWRRPGFLRSITVILTKERRKRSSITPPRSSQERLPKQAGWQPVQR